MVRDVAVGVLKYGGAVLDGVLYFSGKDAAGSELWRSDGTPEGTYRVADINPGGDSSPSYLTAAGGYVHFIATDGALGQEPWRSDGTAEGTVLVKDLWPGDFTSQ